MRSLDMTDKELEKEIEAAMSVTERDSVMFEPVFPPDHANPPKSYFGGLPRLPPEIEWPRAEISVEYERGVDAQGKPASVPVKRVVASTFIAQIELEELPGDIVLPLPKSGTLYFFCDTATDDLIFDGKPRSGGRVIYWPGDSSVVPERPEPVSLAPCFGEISAHYFEWLEHIHSPTVPLFRSFAKWPVRAHAIKAREAVLPFWMVHYAGAAEEGEAERKAREEKNRCTTILGNLYSTFDRDRTAFESGQLPPGSKRNYFLGASAFAAGVSAPDQTHDQLKMWRGGEGFPFAWIDVEIFCGMLIKAMRARSRERSSLRHAWTALTNSRWHRMIYKKSLGQLVVEFVRELTKSVTGIPEKRRTRNDLRLIEHQARQWIERGATAGRFTGVDEAVREEFGRWYDAIVARSGSHWRDLRSWITLQHCIKEAYLIGPRLCLAHSAAAASLVPAAWREHQRWQWALRYEVTPDRQRLIRHQLLGPCDREVVEGERKILHRQDTTIPLMSFDSQEGLYWKWGDVGSIEFRIPEADLAALDFSRCHVELHST